MAVEALFYGVAITSKNSSGATNVDGKLRIKMNMNDRIFQERLPGLFYRLFYLLVNWVREWAARKDLAG